MSQNNRKSNYFAAGWIVRNEDGSAKHVNCQANGKMAKCKVTLTLEDGTVIPADKFTMFFNSNKKEEKHPDVNFVFYTEN